MWGTPYPERPRIKIVEVEKIILQDRIVEVPVVVEVPVIKEQIVEHRVELKVPEVVWCPICWLVRLWRKGTN